MPTRQKGRIEAKLSGIDLLTRAGEHVARGFPIVGMGASAGGRDAFKAFLAAAPWPSSSFSVLILSTSA